MEQVQSPYSEYRQRLHFSSLDGVRCFSIIAVIWHHSMPENTIGLLTKGFLGVDMFFVLSGYLIVTLLLREKDKLGSVSLKKFYIRRSLRIFPIYFGLLLAMGVYFGLIKNDPQEFSFFLSQLHVYLFFVSNWSLVQIPNFSIYWSLATEEQFYLFWPFLQKVASKKGVIIFLVLFIIFNQLVNFGILDSLFIWAYGTKELPHLEILDTTFTPICFGVALAYILHHKLSFNIVHRHLSNSFASLFVLLLLLGIISLPDNDISGIWRLVIQITMSAWLASLVVGEEHVLKPTMTFYPIKRIGQISYGMYLYHMIALHFVRVGMEGYDLALDYTLFLFGSILTTIIAELSFRFYEKPILSFNKHFR